MAIKVAATETKAVVAAVTTIAVLGTGTSISVPGIPSVCTSGGCIGGSCGGLGVAFGGLSLVSGSIPGGGPWYVKYWWR